MIVDDLHVFRTRIGPSEYDPPLLWYLDGIPQSVGKGTAALSIPDGYEIDPVVALNPMRTIPRRRCRLICLQRKRRVPLGACDQLARRANQQKLSSPWRKNIPLHAQPKSTP
jgi:hypothetical protein